MTTVEQPITDGDTPAPDQGVDHAEIIRRQTVAITVMRDRIMELEVELINARCALNERT